MNELSASQTKNATKKPHHPRALVAKKWTAFQELTGPEIGYSRRLAAKTLRIPRTTFQNWNSSKIKEDELDQFFLSEIGLETLHRIICAADFVIQFRECGSRGLQEFIRLSKLDRWIANSIGATHNFSSHLEAEIGIFGNEQSRSLAKGMSKRKIVLGEDETFHVGRPCLVAIELVSNYILVEEYAGQRRAEDWNLATRRALEGLNVEILSSTSDEGTGILAHVKKELKVEHAPDIFHVQQDLSRATAGGLRAQEKEIECELDKGQKKLARIIEKRGKESEAALSATKDRNLQLYGQRARKTRSDEVKASIRRVGHDYHPVDLVTGTWQSPDEVRNKLEACFRVVETAARTIDLSKSCMKKIMKAKEQIAPLVSYLAYWFLLLKQFLKELKLSSEIETFFRDVLLPLAYLEMVFKKTPTKKRGALEPVLKRLRAMAREGPLQEMEREELQARAIEVMSWFQRSSSCVEGRNGVLGMKHHGAHRLSQHRLSALTVVHNFHATRSDGTTPANRFFRKEHDNLFDTVVSRTPMLGKPRNRSARPRVLAA
jgi:hypothetical protein